MSPPDLGGGVRRSRRPGFFSTCFFVFLLLFSSPFPQSTPEQSLLGDSDSLFWVRSFVSLDFRSAFELHRPSCSCMAGSARLRSEVEEPLLLDPKHRSEPYSSPSLRVDSGFARLYSPLVIPTRSTNGFITPLSPSVGRSRSLCPFNPTGDCYFSRCSSRQGRYYFPTPFVPNLVSKFLEDTGVLHGGTSVMEEIFRSALLCQIRLILYKLVAALHSVYLKAETILGPSIPLCPVRMFGRFYPNAFRIFSRLRVTQLTGNYVPVVFSSPALDEPISELLSHYEATNFTDSTFSVTKSETYRKQGNFQATARIFQGALGRTAWILGHGPKIVTIAMLIRMGLGPNIKTIQKTNSRSLDVNFVMYGLFLSFYAYGKRGLGCRIESLDLLSQNVIDLIK